MRNVLARGRRAWYDGKNTIPAVPAGEMRDIMSTQNIPPRAIKVIGHRNPDTDSICSAIAYSNLKNILDPEHP